ncbi:MAG TPA: DUF4080 domain-containing protein, partial [Candidatus Ozemobacteraceae bacterium]|nr:DUF4080 domain-containing protein [Candidatus Ozemobacteraceae bacterium]
TSLSLGCLKSYWQRRSGRPNVEVLDWDMNLGNESLINRLILARPAVLGFATYIWSLAPVVAVAGAVKAALPETRIVLGGPEVLFEGETLMNQYPWIDVIVRGEGEQTWEELLERHLSGSSLAGCAGVLWRGDSGVVRETERGYLQNLDDIPSPFRMGLYGTGRGFTYYEASRGCPFRCAYCLSSVLGPVRHFSLARVIDDLSWFMESEFTQVRFADRTFNFELERAETIVRHILDHNRRQVSFHFELKADLLSDGLIDLLGQAPVDGFHLEIGVQTTHKPALDAVYRRSDLEVLAEKIVRLRERTRAHVHLDLLAGLPEETFPLFQKTLNDAFSWNPSTIQVGLVKVLKGTALQQRVASGDLVCAPLPLYPVVRSRWLSPEEVVLIQDMGKLVEGIHNPGRFSHTLSFLISQAFAEDAARFYEHLARYYRRTGRLFYQLGPEAVGQSLTAFTEEFPEAKRLKPVVEALTLHELRLTQKVPAGKLGPSPLGAQAIGRQKHGWLRFKPGLRAFWYDVDLQPLIGQQASKSVLCEALPSPI